MAALFIVCLCRSSYVPVCVVSRVEILGTGNTPVHIGSRGFGVCVGCCVRCVLRCRPFAACCPRVLSCPGLRFEAGFGGVFAQSGACPMTGVHVQGLGLGLGLGQG